MLLKKALNDGVINRTLNHKLNFNDNYSTRLELQFINLKTVILPQISLLIIQFKFSHQFSLSGFTLYQLQMVITQQYEPF